MARIRTIKAEFSTSDQTAGCSRDARLLFILMWPHCDDAGVHPANVRRLKMEVFPGDNLTDEDVSTWVHELISAELLEEYEVENVRYWRVTGWFKHQKIEYPTSRYPLPDGKFPFPQFSQRTQRPVTKRSASGRRVVGGRSANPRGTLGERSASGRRVVGTEGKGVEGKGKEGNGVTTIAPNDSVPESSAPAPVENFPLNNGDNHEVTDSDVGQYRKLYPAVDVEQELRNMKGWIIANPMRRKTASGIRRFINTWLAKEQNRGGTKPPPAEKPESPWEGGV